MAQSTSMKSRSCFCHFCFSATLLNFINVEEHQEKCVSRASDSSQILISWVFKIRLNAFSATKPYLLLWWYKKVRSCRNNLYKMRSWDETLMNGISVIKRILGEHALTLPCEDRDRRYYLWVRKPTITESIGDFILDFSEI